LIKEDIMEKVRDVYAINRDFLDKIGELETIVLKKPPMCSCYEQNKDCAWFPGEVSCGESPCLNTRIENEEESNDKRN
jgi:hypothetical protein